MEEGGGDGVGEAAAIVVVLWVDEDVAFLGAGLVLVAEADAEGVVEVGGGVERVLAFEDGATDAGQAAGDAGDVGVGWSFVAIRRETFENGFAVSGVSGKVPELVHTEGMPLALILGCLLVECFGKVVSDGREVRIATRSDDDGVPELGAGWLVRPIGELDRRAVVGVKGVHGISHGRVEFWQEARKSGPREGIVHVKLFAISIRVGSFR